MKPMDLMKAALSMKKTEQTAFWELEFHLWDLFSDRPIVPGGAFIKLSAAEKERALYENAEIMTETALKLGFSAVSAFNNYWEIAPGVPSYYWMPDEYRSRQNRILAEKLLECGIMPVALSSAVICMPGSGDSYLDYCYRMFDDPESIAAEAEAVYKNGIQEAERYADAGFGAVVTPSDMADSRGQFFTDEQMDAWILPHLANWAEKLKKLGVFSILHSDGNLDRLLVRLADTGINGLQAVDPTAGMSMQKTREITGGKLCLCGNLNIASLLLKTPEEAVREADDILKLSDEQPGIVIGASNACVSGIPQKTYACIAERIRNHRTVL